VTLPDELTALLSSIRTDFPVLLGENLVGIYLWGSLTYDAFDERCSDVDAVVVTRRDLDGAEFAAMDRWFRESAGRNAWTARLDMRTVIDGEFLDKASRCCGFHSCRLTRHGSDGNPIIWLNVAERGITLWGREARRVAPEVPDRCLDDALLLELEYLKDDLAKNRGDRTDASFRHNAYAVLTACRILHTARHRVLVAKERAYRWALSSLPPEWRPVVEAAWRQRAADHGRTTPELEGDAMGFVRFAEERTRAAVAGRDALDPTQSRP
jgi:streptomycin 3"-adenylyltransferase